MGGGGVPGRRGQGRSRLGLLLADLPAPRPEDLDDLGGDGRRQGHSEEDEALVDGVREGQLRDEACPVLAQLELPGVGCR